MKNLRFFKPVVCASTNPLGTNFLLRKGMVIFMEKLITEYVDIGAVTHPVEHIVIPTDDENRERIIETLFDILTKPRKVPA